MNILLVSDDLMIMSAAEGVARNEGAALTSTSVHDAARRAGELQPSVVALDLRASQLDVAALVPALRASSPKAILILAFGPHVHEASLAAAAAAGCDEVATRGQFEIRLRSIVDRIGRD